MRRGAAELLDAQNQSAVALERKRKDVTADVCVLMFYDERLRDGGMTASQPAEHNVSASREG